MPTESAVLMQDAEALAREAESALQVIAVQNAEEIARVAQETRTTFGRVEEGFKDMDSRVESMGASL